MAADDVQQVTDSRVLAALAHPLRRRLMDVLKVHGPGTVSVLAGHTGQSVANVSHHLKVLDTSGLVAQAPELAKDRRERWWRLVSAGLRWSNADFTGSAADAAIAHAAESLNLDHHTDLVRAWLAADEEQRASWNEASFSTDKWLHLTPTELTELSEQVIELFRQWSARQALHDGQLREPVFVFAYGMPSQP